MRRLAILLAALLTISAAPALTAAQVRDFLARQERAWNRGDLAGYFAGYDREAVFVDQARSNENTIVPYGRSTVRQAQAQARRTFAEAKVRETGEVRRIEIAGATARVWTFEVTRIERAGRVQTYCAERLQALSRVGARIVSTGQTDTIVRCRGRS
jgi:hypothetical protein